MRIRRGRTLSAALLAFALGLGFASPVLAATGDETPAPGNESPQPTEAASATGDGVLTIGTVLPSSGDAAASSRTQRAAVERAVRDLSQAGGIPGLTLRVLHRNAGADAATGRAAALELIEAGADALLVHADLPGTLELLALAEAHGVVLLSTELDDPVLLRQNSGGYLLSTRSSQETLGSVLAQQLFGQASPAGQEDAAGAAADEEAGTEAAADADSGSTDDPFAQGGTEGEAVPSSTVVLLGQADLTGRLIEAAVLQARPDDVAVTLLSLPLGEDAGQEQQLVAAAADAGTVVFAPATAAQAERLLPLLLEAGIAPERLILARAAVRDYSEAELPVALTGAQALRAGQSADEELMRLLTQSDPAVRSGDHGAESYDAVIVLALAALFAGDDAGSALAEALSQGAPAGNDAARCDFIAACLEAADKGYRPYFTGVLGTLAVAAGGTVQSVGATRYAFDEVDALIEAERLLAAPTVVPMAPAAR